MSKSDNAPTSRLLSETDYINTLTPENKKWLYHFTAGTLYGSTRHLAKITSADQATVLAADCTQERNEYRADMMNKWSEKKSADFEETNLEDYHILFTEGHYMSSFEDAVNDKIDSERLGKAYTAGSYGNNSDVPVGADVVVCIEGHHLQNRIGKVTGKRRGQLLVLVQTTKGDVTLYVSPYEVAHVNQAKKVG